MIIILHSEVYNYDVSNDKLLQILSFQFNREKMFPWRFGLFFLSFFGGVGIFLFVYLLLFYRCGYGIPCAGNYISFHIISLFQTDSLVYNQEVAVSVRITNAGVTQQTFDVAAADTAGFVTSVIKHVTLDGKQTKTMDFHITAIPPATYTLVFS